MRAFLALTGSLDELSGGGILEPRGLKARFLLTPDE